MPDLTNRREFRSPEQIPARFGTDAVLTLALDRLCAIILEANPSRIHPGVG